MEQEGFCFYTFYQERYNLIMMCWQTSIWNLAYNFKVLDTVLHGMGNDTIETQETIKHFRKIEHLHYNKMMLFFL